MDVIVETRERPSGRDLEQEHIATQVNEYLGLCRRAKEFFHQYPTDASQKLLRMINAWQKGKSKEGIKLQVFALGSLGWKQSRAESDIELGILVERGSLPPAKIGVFSPREELRKDFKLYLRDRGIQSDLGTLIISFDNLEEHSVIVNFLIFSAIGVTLGGERNPLANNIRTLLKPSWEKSKFRDQVLNWWQQSAYRWPYLGEGGASVRKYIQRLEERRPGVDIPPEIRETPSKLMGLFCRVA